MVPLHIQLHYLTSGKPAYRLDTNLSGFLHCPDQYPKTVLRSPYNVVLAMPYRV
jgi:hypothetical protein